MDQVGQQIGQNPMQSHPLSQSMDSVNTASNEEEVSRELLIQEAELPVVMFCLEENLFMNCAGEKA